MPTNTYTVLDKPGEQDTTKPAVSTGPTCSSRGVCLWSALRLLANFHCRALDACELDAVGLGLPPIWVGIEWTCDQENSPPTFGALQLPAQPTSGAFQTPQF